MDDVKVHEKTSNPTEAWKEISQNQRVIRIAVKNPQNAAVPGKIRIVAMSDTHSLQNHIKFSIPDGDIFVHAGDLSKCGKQEEVIEFNNWLGTLPHKHKIVIAGNHELSFDPLFTHPFNSNARNCCKAQTLNLLDEIPTLGNPKEHLEAAVRTDNVKQYLTNCIYLEDSAVELYGLKFYGSPYQPEFCKWAFNLQRGQPCLDKWNLIPSDVDILITHTPPIGFGDLCCSGLRAGCVELLSTVQKRLKNVKYHIFGHVHESYGIYSDGKVIYINASTCDLNYQPNNRPIVFDVSTKSNS